jgi:dethiobiotin synthetase
LILASLGEPATPEAIAAISPWRFEAPLAPPWAAAKAGRPLAFDQVLDFCRAHEASDADHLLIEGAGGVMSPIDESHTCLDLIAALGFPAILVTGSYLGAISHALTAIRALQSEAIDVRGVVVSQSQACAGLSETAQSVERLDGSGLSVLRLCTIHHEREPKWLFAESLINLCRPGRLNHGR